MRRFLGGAALVLTMTVGAPTTALAHPERATIFPDGSTGSVPDPHTKGPTLIVCKSDSKARIFKATKVRTEPRRHNLALLRHCHFNDIQAAVDHAKSGYRILVLPGVYREEPSRAVPVADPKCKDDYEATEGNSSHFLPPPVGARSNDPTQRANFRYQHDCPNSRSLIAVIGDGNPNDDRKADNTNWGRPDPARRCNQKCNLEIAGTANAHDVVIESDQLKPDGIRVDRADGIVLRNFTVQYAEFNDIDVVETNGFRIQNVITKYAKDYGVLTFTDDHGLYDRIWAYGNGDSGVYPGSGPEGHCARYGIEIRRVVSHDNVLGYSGTAGNGVWAHDNWFFNNSAGMSTDSFAAGHPGMPQDCAKWTNNRIYHNNADLFNQARAKYCQSKPFDQRDPTIVCPQFEVPEGSGIIMYGADRNLVADNYIYDNWRSGVRLFYVPAALRGENDPAKQFDTSNGNQFLDNRMGVTPDGVRDPNGEDFTWDNEGVHNCWDGNTGPGGAAVTSNQKLDKCPGRSILRPASPTLEATEVPCATWDPVTNTDPPGCSWFTVPPEPK